MNVAAEHLRQRARLLRALADAIERSPVMRLDRDGDDDTWRGPRPDLCRATLAANQRQLRAAADDLHRHADRFDRRAVELETLAGPATGVAG